MALVHPKMRLLRGPSEPRCWRVGDLSVICLPELRAIFSTLSPVIFFVGMTLILFVTIYASHRLLLKVEEHFDFFVNTTRRSHELKNIYAEIEGLAIEIRKERAVVERAKKRLPADPQYRYSQIASDAIHGALHRMKRSLRSLKQPDPVLKWVSERKADIPDQIETSKQGQMVIAEIAQSTTPYAILMHLDAYPMKEED